MKSAVREARSQASEVQSVSPERLHSARTVPHRVPRPLARRLLEVVGFEDLATQVPGPEHQRGVAHVRPALKVGYVVDQFPRASHGFLLNEILELESRGIDVHIFSLRMPEGRVDDTACALARLRGPVRYFSEMEGFHSDIPSIDGTFHYTFAIDSFGQARMGRGLTASAARWVANQIVARDIEHVHAHGATVATDVAREAARLSSRGYSFTAYADGLYEGADEPALCEKVMDCRFAVTLSDWDRR